MKFYSFDDIKGACSCLDVARDYLKLDINGEGRCAATWRGGTNTDSVAINADGFYDHGSKDDSGSVIDLVALVNHNGNVHAAQEALGQYLNLEHAMQTTVGRLPGEAPRNRYDRLIDQGYVEADRYPYTDTESVLLHQVIRMEHPDPAEGQDSKSFIQTDPNDCPSVKGIHLVLYNLPNLKKSKWAAIVEGEKDANTLKAWGIPGTCNAGGAEKWLPQYSEELKDKDVVIFPDNDEAGQRHAQLVASNLKGFAKSIRIVTISKLDKGDVTDWRDKEGGTKELLFQAFKAVKALDMNALPEPDPEQGDIKAAKDANKYGFNNYFIMDDEQPNGKIKKIPKPKKIGKMIEDCHTRFLGFPRKVGEVLFDHDRGTNQICYVLNDAMLMAWIMRKSKHQADFNRGPEFCSKREFLEGLSAEAIRYEGISHVPDYPIRPDIFYTHGELPPPSPGHEVFNGLAKLFCLAGPEYDGFLRAFIAAPLFYRYGIPRPLWIIDSEDGQNTGKTTLVEIVSYLYGNDPITVGQKELDYQGPEIMKRLVTSDGRLKRIFLLDNVTGDYSSRELSSLITRQSISARAPYGRTEETRPNNLTYVITANSANVDSDLATRAFYIFVKRPPMTDGWKTEAFSYIDENRMQIFADMIDLVKNHECEMEDVKPTTRFPEFEMGVLFPMCQDFSTYADSIKLLEEVKASSNVDDDIAFQIEEIIRTNLSEMDINPEDCTVFLLNAVIDAWLTEGLPEKTIDRTSPMQLVRNLSKTGLLSRIDKKKRRLLANGRRSSGALWISAKNDYKEAHGIAGKIDHIVFKKGRKFISEVGPHARTNKEEF